MMFLLEEDAPCPVRYLGCECPGQSSSSVHLREARIRAKHISAARI